MPGMNMPTFSMQRMQPGAPPMQQMPMQMQMPQYMQGMHVGPFTSPGGMAMPFGAGNGGLTHAPQLGITINQAPGTLRLNLHSPRER